MKRGYMDWRKDLLPQELLQQRQAEYVGKFADLGIDAAVVFSDVGIADELQYLTNLGPYFFFIAGVFLKDGSVTFVTGLSGRVNPWIAMMTGADNSRIIAAGPQGFNIKIAELLKETLGGKGTVGLTGKYLPRELAAALENAGLKTVSYPMDEQLQKRDEAYLQTVKEGLGLILPALRKVFDDSEIMNMEPNRIAAELEYAFRTAGAMDVVLLYGDRQLVFDQPQAVPANERPWNMYIQVQYLGEWLALGRNMQQDCGKQAEEARDRIAKKLVPGERRYTWEEEGYTCSIKTPIRADFLATPTDLDYVLREGQIISLALEDKKKGIYLLDMYRVTASGGQLLTAI